MKKILFITVILFAAVTSFSQDILVMQNGDEIQTKILEVNDSQVKYKLFDDLEGSIYIINRADAFKIKYESGSESVLNEHKMVDAVEENLPSKRRVGLAVRPEIGGLLITENGIPEATKSADFSVNIVYQIRNKISMGIGAAYDITTDAGHFVPVYFNLRGYFSDRLSCAYYDIRVGYAIPAKKRVTEYITYIDNQVITDYSVVKIKGEYLRLGFGADIYNFSLGANIGLCARSLEHYTQYDGGNIVRTSGWSISLVYFGVSVGYNIQCSKEK